MTSDNANILNIKLNLKPNLKGFFFYLPLNFLQFQFGNVNNYIFLRLLYKNLRSNVCTEQRTDREILKLT